MSNFPSAMDSQQCSPQAKPEWLRIPEAVRLFGISRSTLYTLIQDGKIKSASIRHRGALRGIRLISFDSLAAFVESQSSIESRSR